jgi:hypothetical protein
MRKEVRLPWFPIAEDFSMNTKADCCKRPTLRIIEAMPDDSDAKVSVQKCDNCQTFWQVVVDQVITEKGEILVWDWFRPLEEEEALGIMECMAPH